MSLFDEAMREGYVTLEILKMLISGVAGSGKTSTLALLLGVDPPEIRRSTPCACRPVCVIPIVSDPDGAIWRILEESGLKTLLAELVKVHEKIESDVHPNPSSLPVALKQDVTVISEKAQVSNQPHPFTKPNPNQASASQQAADDAMKLQPSASIAQVQNLEETSCSSPNPLLESSATEDEFVRLIDQSGGQDIHLKRRWISITDTGGQPQFREVLPVFLRQTSLFVHVQKLSEALSDKPVIEYYDQQGQPLSKPIKSHLTNEEHVKCAVRSVYSLRFGANEEKPPKMLFIATHEDEEHKSSEKREVKEDKMAELALPISSQNGVIYCGNHMSNVLFGVNTNYPGYKEKQMAATIRNIINELFPPTGKKIPLRWFVLQLKLQEIARVLGRLVITKQECLQAAKRIHLNSEEVLDAALEYLDELNIIFYYPKILPDLVFCNIQVIIDKLTELVEHLYKLMEDSDDCSAYTGDWKKFREFGLITETILKHFQSHYVPAIFTFHHLIRLFRSLLVIADFHRYDQEKQEYFMPCLLHTIEAEKVAKHKDDSKPRVPSLVLHFPDGLLNGVFCFTIASLLSSENTTHKPWKLKQRDGSPVCLYRNIVQFTIPKYPGTITLIDRFDFIEVVVGSCPEKLCKVVCPLVKKAILQSLAKASKLLNYIPCEPEEAVLCPCEDPNPHPAEVIELEGEKWWVCSKDEDNCDELGEIYDVWNDKQNSDGMKITDDSLTLSNISSALEDVVDWHWLAIFLGIKKAKLDAIRLDYREYGQARQKYEMIDLWLRSDSNASWEKLCTALERVDEGAIASRIRATYLPGPHHTKDPSHTIDIASEIRATRIKLAESEEELHHIKAIENAIKERGTLILNLIHGVLIGVPRSGKSSLMIRLLGEMLASISPSTGVMDKVIQVEVRKSLTTAASIESSSDSNVPIWTRISFDQEAIRLMTMASLGIKAEPEIEPDLQPAAIPGPPVQLPSDPSVMQDEVIEPKFTPNSVVQQQQQCNITSTEQVTVIRSKAEVREKSRLLSNLSPLEVFKTAIRKRGLKAIEEKLEKSSFLYLTDTGGQIEFQELLCLLVSGPSVFFIVFRLDQDLKKTFTVKYLHIDRGNTMPYQSTMTLKEALLQSLASIAAMHNDVFKGTFLKHKIARPKVLFVGTHKDLVTQNEIERIDKQLQEMVESTSLYREDLVVSSSEDQLAFTVNNLSQVDSDFQKIRSAVDRIGSHGEFQMISPAHWLIYSLVIRNSGKRIISFDEALQVAQKCGIKSREELDEVLWFLHTKMGVLRHFPEDDLHDVVILDPQVLFDMVTELIVDTFTFENASVRVMNEFKKKGIFPIDIFQQVGRAQDKLLTPARLIKLLLHLRIIAPYQTDPPQYFIPCALAHTEDAPTSDELPSTDVPPLLIVFKCGYIPKGLPGSLIVYLLRNEMKSENEFVLEPDTIYKNQLSFRVGIYNDVASIRMEPTHLAISCTSGACSSRIKPHQFEDICNDIRKSVEKGVKKIINDLPYTSDADHSITFYCTFTECLHPAKVHLNKKGVPCGMIWCNKVKKSTALPTGYQKWFTQISPTTGSKTEEHTHQDLFCQHTDQSTRLCEMDVSRLVEIFAKYASKWKDIGLQLGFTVDELDTISASPPGQAARVNLTTMLNEWVHWTPGTSHGKYATLEDLEEVLRKDTVGLGTVADHLHSTWQQQQLQAENVDAGYHRNTTVSTEISKQTSGATAKSEDSDLSSSDPRKPRHSSTSSSCVITPDQYREIFKLLLPMANEWQELAVLFSIPHSVMEDIKKESTTVRSCLRAMLSEWLKQSDPRPTWSTLAEAVELLGNQAKAEEIRKNYMTASKQ